jgi:uncharacterized RDD family membrane protein YckC
LDLAFVFGIDILVSSRFGLQEEPLRWKLTGLPACLMILFWPMYWLVPESLFGATLGKAVLGLRVYPVQSGYLAFVQVLKRNVVKALDAMTFYVMGFCVSLSNPLRQTVGDLWARTMVVEKTVLDRWRAGSQGATFDDWMKSLHVRRPRR